MRFTEVVEVIEVAEAVEAAEAVEVAEYTDAILTSPPQISCMSNSMGVWPYFTAILHEGVA